MPVKFWLFLLPRTLWSCTWAHHRSNILVHVAVSSYLETDDNHLVPASFFALNCKTNSSSATRASNFTYLFINSGIEFNTSITQMWCLTSTIIHSQAFGWSIVHRILSSADVCARSSWRNHCLCLQCRAISCTLTQRFCSTVFSTAWPPHCWTTKKVPRQPRPCLYNFAKYSPI